MSKKDSITIGSREQEAGSRFFAGYISAFFLISLIHINLYAQARETVFPRLEPDPKALEYYNIGKSNYTWQELAQISLWASSGNSITADDSNLRQITSIYETIRNSPDFPAGQTEQAGYILSYLHRNVFRSYTLLQSRVDSIFTAGRYNCVSSSVLYAILCKAFNIETSGVITKDHAFVAVYADSRSIDVETTNRYGFDPGARREFQDQFGRITGFSYVPPQNYRDRRTISLIQLVSLILNNRINEHERQRRYADPVPLAIDRACLLLGANPSSANDNDYDDLFKNPYSELIDKAMNYGGMLLRNNREEDAIQWAVISSEKFPSSERWQELYFTAINNRAVRYLRANQITEARSFLENNKQYLAGENYSRINLPVIDAELLRSATGITNIAESESAISAIENARNQNQLSENRANELKNFAIQKTASVLAALEGGSRTADNLRTAITYLESARNRYGANREIEQSIRSYRNALAADYHNRFAAEWNRQNYEEAGRILNEGLEEFPDNRQLLNNKAMVERQRNR